MSIDSILIAADTAAVPIELVRESEYAAWFGNQDAATQAHLTAQRFEGKRYALSSIIQMQARHVATFVRGQRAVYEPFVMSW